MANCNYSCCLALLTLANRGGRCVAAFVAMLVLLPAVFGYGGTGASSDEGAVLAARFAGRAATAYLEAKRGFRAAPANPTAAWQFARACFDLAEYATNSAQRAAVAREGIAASRELVRSEPSSAPAYYYLGMNLGQLARTESLGALSTVEQMEKAFKRARDLDETFDYSGPDRCLGLLYLNAPGWPVSVGNRRKARAHLEKAAAGAPDYPENRINLLEAYLHWGDLAAAAREWHVLRALLPKAREKFTGDQWESSWADWGRRQKEIEKRIQNASDR